jgi:CBS domain-containing protein
MLRQPKTLHALASVKEARELLADEHVHMVLLTRGRLLVGTLVRDDLPLAMQERDPTPALPWSTLRDRTVLPHERAETVQESLLERGLRRVAVVDVDGTLLGLMCLKRTGAGFCSDHDVRSRARSPRAPDRERTAQARAIPFEDHATERALGPLEGEPTSSKERPCKKSH